MSLSLPTQQADSNEARSVDGHVMRGTRTGPVPLAKQWVLLQRVGPDKAAPLDSTRTDGSGHYHLNYHTLGDPSAVYFTSTSYGGVAYFTSPFIGPVAKGDDGLITVFDTTSGPVAIKVGGHHLVIGAPEANGMRPVGEVYDLQNDSTVTLVARDSSTPVFVTQIPPAALNFQLNPDGDLAAGAVGRSGQSVALFAPLSPGIRQLAFTYELPAKAFPLTIPIARPTGVLEVLVQEPSVRLSGVKLREMPPVSTDGREFLRYLGQDVAANSVVSFDFPHLIGPERKKAYLGIGLVLVLAMVVSLLYASRRALRLRFAGIGGASDARAQPPRQTREETLVRSIADLDANFERQASPDAAARAAYEARRLKLKADLAKVLAGEKHEA